MSFLHRRSYSGFGILLALLMVVVVILNITNLSTQSSLDEETPEFDFDTNFDYYAILGVSHNATQQEIKAAYKKLTIKYHPDRNRNKTKQEQESLNAKYQKIAKAYEVLSDEEQRRTYDQYFEFGANLGAHLGIDEQTLEFILYLLVGYGYAILAILILLGVVLMLICIMCCLCVCKCCCSFFRGGEHVTTKTNKKKKAD
ncbi:hypothetical protein FDP41_003541 [Naegleria fowleri]|uniref:J domain-containing protein n=1 Tax=Naegleria fowleri TaxID=5763 RepID=A0A6A5BX96_NAEFO|nr:uncharacterized protein FDP41_003541 [Naegleria fowleri]KAF0977549.1 hypothetical protein FDP41_003541 [Naegleria fowleri]CAG4708375.1 unnamed protein product [Naegleria fowleri]